jgi:hypothetical protein
MFRFWVEQNKRIRDIAKMNRYMNLCIGIGFPAFSVFMFSFYRRFLATPPFSKELQLQYGFEVNKKPPKST